jgi:hypothetical protein
VQTVVITKYLFRIRTRSGVLVENLAISGRDEADARRKLCTICRGCEVQACQVVRPSPVGRNGNPNYEDVVDLIIAS